MICTACNKVSNSTEKEDCFEIALDLIKKHYVYYKNALQQRDLEIQQVKERNEKLNKALQLLQKTQHATKRFKLQHGDSWLGRNTSQEDHVASDLSLTDDEPMGANNLNVALNSEQLFDTSAFSQPKNNVSIASSSEIVQSPLVKQSPKRNKQHDAMRKIKARKNKFLERSKSEWHAKEGNSPEQKYWATKFLQPTKNMVSEEKLCAEGKKTVDKKLCLSLKKTNPSKVKQTLINFNKSKDSIHREANVAEDVIGASPAIISNNSKAGRSWAHRSGHNCSNTNEISKKYDADKSLDDIVFDFSPSKKSDSTLNSLKTMESKQLKLDTDISKDNLGHIINKSDSSSVVILTPGTQDIIFVDDTCNLEPEIDTMDLLADIMKQSNTDNLEKLKTFERTCIQNKQKNKETDLFKKPSNILQTDVKVNTLAQLKQEKISQENLQQQKDKNDVEHKLKISSYHKPIKSRNPLFSSDEQDTEDDDDFMPKPFVIKQESESAKPSKRFSIKQRFNIDCEDCEKLINFLDDRLTDAQIQQHLDKCKRHNNLDIMRQNTPTDFWNPFILSFQADDPRNEILIDERFKNSK